MQRKVTVTPRWYGPVPTRNGKALPMNQWARAGRKRRWSVRWRAPDGTRPCMQFDGKAEADDFARQKTAEFEERGPQARIRPKAVTVGEYRDEYLRLRIGPHGKRLSMGTVRAYTPALTRFVETMGPDIPLADITPADIARFMARAQSRYGLSPATLNKYKGALKAVLSVAVSQLGYLQFNPCDKTRKDKLADKPVRYVDPGEYAALIDTCATREDRALWWEAFIATCYTSATRKNEAAHLTWSDIDFEGDKIRIIAKPETAGVEAWQPKDHDSRTVPVPRTTIDLLAKLHSTAPDGAQFVFIPPERVLWIKLRREAGKWTEGQDVINNLDRDFKRIATAAGIVDQDGKATVCLHDLRRSAISHWARKLAAPVTQKLAGHADIKTTLKYYVSIREADLSEAREVTADALLVDAVWTPNGPQRTASGQTQHPKT